MYISKEDLDNLKYAQDFDNGNLQISPPPYVPTLTSSEVLREFHELNNRDIDFSNTRDLNQISYLNAFNAIKSKSTNLDFLIYSDSSDLKNLFSVFSAYSQDSESQILSAALELGAVPASELIKKLNDWFNNNQYITANHINALAKRGDASYILMYIYKSTPKEFLALLNKYRQ